MIEVMVANLVSHFNWELPPESLEHGIDMTESFGLTVRRSEDLLLVPVVPSFQKKLYECLSIRVYTMFLK